MPTISFLEFCGVLFVLYAITQYLLPWVFPKDLEVNWLFKKKKPVQDETTAEKVNSLLDQKEAIKTASKEVITQTQQELDEAKEIHEAAKKLAK